MGNDFGSVDIFCEFLEAAIHQILHARGVYPKELFQRGKLYNVPVQKSRHPELNDYVSHLVRSIHSWMSKGGVESVILLIVDSRQQPLERFVFEFRVLPIITIFLLRPSPPVPPQFPSVNAPESHRGDYLTLRVVPTRQQSQKPGFQQIPRTGR